MGNRIIKRSGKDTLVCGGELIRSEKPSRDYAFGMLMYKYTCKECKKSFTSTNKAEPFCSYEVKNINPC
jgi:hypothetical protein